ncbi:hypothetical protein ACL02T_31875 [Pseudonocardia sp. RS010]|uniref:hypothetical protein n=1 Tax=Pseudonocardia sp. RS010 TaxID=3385979 RepID=UPI00399F74C8
MANRRTDVPADVVGNEFAEVRVTIDGEANSRRVRLEDLSSGKVRYLDALELETLVWLPPGHLQKLLDPSADRWREDNE